MNLNERSNAIFFSSIGKTRFHFTSMICRVCFFYRVLRVALFFAICKRNEKKKETNGVERKSPRNPWHRAERISGIFFFFLVPWPAAPPAALFVFHPRHLCFLLVIWILFLFLVPLSCFVLFCSGPSGNNRCTGGDFWSLTPRSCVVIGAFRRLLLQQLQLIAFAFKRSIRRPRKIGELKKNGRSTFVRRHRKTASSAWFRRSHGSRFVFFSHFHRQRHRISFETWWPLVYIVYRHFFTEFLARTSWWSWFFFIGEGRFDDFGRHFRLMDPVMEFIGVKPSKTQ